MLIWGLKRHCGSPFHVAQSLAVSGLLNWRGRALRYHALSLRVKAPFYNPARAHRPPRRSLWVNRVATSVTRSASRKVDFACSTCRFGILCLSVSCGWPAFRGLQGELRSISQSRHGHGLVAPWQSARRVRKIACKAQNSARTSWNDFAHAAGLSCRNPAMSRYRRQKIECRIFFFTVLLAGPVQPACVKHIQFKNALRPTGVAIWPRSRSFRSNRSEVQLRAKNRPAACVEFGPGDFAHPTKFWPSPKSRS